jgi:cytochrome c553
MNKILIRIIVLMAALIICSSRAKATSAGLSTAHQPEVSISAITYSDAPTSLVYLKPNEISSLNTTSQSITDDPNSLDDSKSILVATQPMGRLDNIGWNELANPDYESVFSHLLLLPTRNETWAYEFTIPESASGNDNLQSINYELSLEANRAYSLLHKSEAYGESGGYCASCHGSLNSISWLNNQAHIEQANQVYGNPPTMIACTNCHLQTPAQISWQIRGVE